MLSPKLIGTHLGELLVCVIDSAEGCCIWTLEVENIQGIKHGTLTGQSLLSNVAADCCGSTLE